jgi:hypothetical protein
MELPFIFIAFDVSDKITQPQNVKLKYTKFH